MKRLRMPTEEELREQLKEEFQSAIVLPTRLTAQHTAVADIARRHKDPPQLNVRALVDTGATMSLISVHALGKFPYQRLPARAKGLMTSLLGPMPARGAVQALVQPEGGPELPMTFAVMDLNPLTRGLLAFNMVLGLDYLRASMAQIDLARVKVAFGVQSFAERSPAQAGQPGVPLLAELDPSRLSISLSEEESRVLERLSSRIFAARMAGSMPVFKSLAGPDKDRVT